MSFNELNELNKKLNEFINNPDAQKIIQNIDNIEKSCYIFLNKKDIVIENNNYSKEIKLDETLKIIYQFLLNINKELAIQFINLIYSVDEIGKPIFNFKPVEDEEFPINGVLKNGKVNIYYTNTIDDLFTITHEFFHLSNDSKIVDKSGEVTYNKYRDEYSETVSIAAEYLLGQYLVYNQIITENDFNKRKKFRYEDTKNCAERILVQCKLIRKYIDDKNISDEYYNKISKSDFYKKGIKGIVYGMGMNLSLLLKYVNGQLYTDKILSSPQAIDDFIQLNHVIGNINCSFEDTSKILR